MYLFAFVMLAACGILILSAPLLLSQGLPVGSCF